MADEDLPQAERQQIIENTYQLKPADDEKFKAADVRRMMAALLDERLKGKKYDAGQCNQLSKDLCTDIKSRVKGERRLVAPLCSVADSVLPQKWGVRFATRSWCKSPSEKCMAKACE